MKILILAQHFAPEDVSGAVLATELATDLVRLKQEVTFLTCAPNYPYGVVYSGYRNRIIQKEVYGRVKVVRVWSYITKGHRFSRRILNFASFSVMAFFGGLTLEKPDLIMSYSPPLPLGVSAWLLKIRWGIPWILRVEDLFPDAAIALGVIRNRFSILFFHWLEKFLYHRADHISVISPGFLNNLSSKGIKTEKLSFTPVWADPNLYEGEIDPNAGLKQFGFGDYFIVLYAGNLGLTSQLEDLVEVAKILRKEMIKFIFVGEGVKKEALQNQMADFKNVSFLSYQSRTIYAAMQRSAGVNLVTLNQHSASFSLPNKLFGMMASARPVLAITPEDSEIAQLVLQAECGVNIPPGQPEEIAKEILRFKNAPGLSDQMGQNGKRIFVEKYSRRVIVNQFNQLFSQFV